MDYLSTDTRKKAIKICHLYGGEIEKVITELLQIIEVQNVTIEDASISVSDLVMKLRERGL